jgi:uncharacterized membrane protein YccC/class 3 adenylate cyclase
MSRTRRLAAILTADVVGYSRLMGIDEERTLGALKQLRRELADPKIEEHHGRLVKTTGDGLLVEFASVVDAVRCAVEVQREMAERNVGVPAESRIELRIGINLGDIIIGDHDIFGDAVNVAARLEALADAGGVFVSNTVHDNVRDRLPFVFEDLGERHVKNIARPIRVYRVRCEHPLPNPPPQAGEGSARSVRVGAAEPPVLPLPDKPSIAVLPLSAEVSSGPHLDFKSPVAEANWVPWIFAAKTTASALIALLVAFTFNLDQPYWGLLTVFIVAQPQSGLVLAKSFYRIIGTVIGAAVALLFVALFAQERVLFLGALALWVGLCTFGSQYARNFAAYSFVLSGYTAAIVGISGALDAGNAFYIATGRVTEISLGIIATATVSHIVLPSSLAASLWRAVAEAHAGLADYGIALLGDGDASPLRAKLLGQAIAIENLRASAIFEDREIRDRSDSLRLLVAALINVVGVAQLLSRQLGALGRTDAATVAGIDYAIAEATAAIKGWRVAAIDTAELSRCLLRVRARLPRVRQLCRDQCLPDEEVIQRIAVSARLREFFAALTLYAEVYEVFVSAEKPAPRRIGFAHSNDPVATLWTGLRAALAVFLVSGFWILTNWPHGSTAAILGAVATARLATMGSAVPIAVAATLIFALSTIPAFIIVEILLPFAEGFEMFALAVAPMLFLCAFLMAQKRTYLIGFFSALLFASGGQFLNKMAYDPVGLINTSIAAVVAAAVAMMLWAVVAPATPEAARRRFVDAARQALARIAAPRLRIGLAEFVTAMTEALDQLKSGLRPDQPDDIAAFEAAIALFGAGRELIRLREDRASSITAALELDIAELAGNQRAQWLDRARRTAQEAAAKCLAELREDGLGTEQAQAAARKIVAFAAIRDELERGGALLTGEKHGEAQSDAA